LLFFSLLRIIIRLSSQCGLVDMEKIDNLAMLSVGRGVGFAALGIATFMIGLSADLAMSLKSGGILALITSLTLFMKGLRAPRHNYKHTELWVMLNPDDRPNAAVAQGMIGEALKRTYLSFALHAALVAGGFLFLSLLVTTAIALR
jgi:hypothetical protein